MPEPLDPIAAGVATALKSLRSRAGLREDRLTDTDIALDVFVGLTAVRHIVATGATTEQAIVQAVREVTATLEPTDSIVADVILGLGLQSDSLPDPELYADELGRRRAALRRNWQQLHQLRSVASNEPVPSQRALRFDVETQALSALAEALTADEGEPATGGEVRAVSKPPARAQLPLLSEEFRRIAAALREALIAHEDGMGWAQDLRRNSVSPYLRKNSMSPSPVSTSFGLQTIILLEGFLAADLVPVVDFLRRQAAPGGGYAAEAQVAPRSEGTATVLDALHKVDGTAPFTAHVASMSKGIGDFERTRPFLLARILETSARSGRDPDLIRTVTADLLKARLRFGGRWLWSQKAEEDLVAPKPSTVHTALAVRALVLAEDVLAEEDELRNPVREAIEDAGAWLAEGQDLDSTSELVERRLESGKEIVYERHFTAAWVVKALVSIGLPATHPSVDTAVRRVWQDYHRETALWRWSNGDLPVWMTFDAVEAVYLAAFAVPIPPSV
jgi:hypothetical protein